jgi:transketolase
MIVGSQHLNKDLFSSGVEHAPTRRGFGEGLLLAGQADSAVVALCADLTESTQMQLFHNEFPDRFVEVGIAEQNLVTVASGLAAVGKKPFVSSYAAFSPGRNWEQIRTTIALNDQPVVVVGSHAGLSVGPDGATHQMLEDIALMRVLPNMTVVVPADIHEARKATLAAAKLNKPVYIRLARERTAVITTEESPFEVGKAQVLHEGEDVTIIGCGPVLHEALLAAQALAEGGIRAEVINVATIKPLDEDTILASVRKTGAVVSVEEGQVIGGLGGAIAELLAEELPAPLSRVGVDDRFGQSGKVAELWREYGLTVDSIVTSVHTTVKRKAL